MDTVVNKYSYQASLDNAARQDAEDQILNSECQSGIPSIRLPPISRVSSLWFQTIDKYAIVFYR